MLSATILVLAIFAPGSDASCSPVGYICGNNDSSVSVCNITEAWKFAARCGHERCCTYDSGLPKCACWEKKVPHYSKNHHRRASVIIAHVPFTTKPREPVCDASISHDAKFWKARGLVRGEDELSFQSVAVRTRPIYSDVWATYVPNWTQSN